MIGLCAVEAEWPAEVGLTAKMLLERSAEDRSRILAVTVAGAEPLYRDNTDLTGFDAFGEDDLYDYPDEG